MDYKTGKTIEELVYILKKTLGYYGDKKETDPVKLFAIIRESHNKLESILERMNSL